MFRTAKPSAPDKAKTRKDQYLDFLDWQIRYIAEKIRICGIYVFTIGYPLVTSGISIGVSVTTIITASNEPRAVSFTAS